jgi:DNA-binding transcriptional MerR regulator
MLEQLDLFGENPSSQPKPKPTKAQEKYKIVPPRAVVIDDQFSEQETTAKFSTEEQSEEIKQPVSKQKQKHDFNNVSIPEDEVLFSKQYYPISEVAKMLNVNISLLRFWEKEFNIIKPRKNRKGDRLFRPEDVKNLKLIYFLLKEKKYTIEGANSFIKKEKYVAEKYQAIESLKKLKQLLIEFKAGLAD